MNNGANNTNPELGGKPYTDLISYWNFYQTDEQILTSWKFFTFIDNLSFLGGLLDIMFLVPSLIMIAYTFRINEINVFFYQQVMKNFQAGSKSTNVDDVKKLDKDPNTRYTRYIMDNYSIISFKVAIGVAMINLKLPEIYKYLKKKFQNWKNRSKNGVKDKKTARSNEDIATEVTDTDSDSESDSGQVETN